MRRARRATRTGKSPAGWASSGAAGAGSLAGIVAAQTGGAARFARMQGFFEGVGAGDAAGYGWAGKPVEPKGARERYRKAREAKARASEAMGS